MNYTSYYELFIMNLSIARCPIHASLHQCIKFLKTMGKLILKQQQKYSVLIIYGQVSKKSGFLNDNLDANYFAIKIFSIALSKL